MLQGTYYSNMDAKGRIAVPARHREALQVLGDEGLVGTAHHREACLVLRPNPVWQALAQRLREMPNGEPSVQLLQRKLLGNAQDLSPDTNGRILLPPSLREYAKLGKRVAAVGLGECLEVWDADAWEEQMKRDVVLLPETMRDLHL